MHIVRYTTVKTIYRYTDMPPYIQLHTVRCTIGKATTPFMHSRSRYQCGNVTLINQISTEAVMWLILCVCICVTNALLT